MKIKGKRVLVTGGAMRVGREIVRALARQDACVIIHCNQSHHEAIKLLEEIGGTAKGHSVQQCDLSNFKELNSLMDSISPIDILVNNASTFQMNSLASEDFEEARIQFDVNYWAPVELMRIFHEQGLDDGVIINILDQRIDNVDPRGGSYPITKNALRDATRQAALQWAPRIRVNGIAPGPVLPPTWLPESKMEKTLKEVPLNRKVDMDDFTESVKFLIRNESITGDIIYVDCGQHLV